MKQNKIRHPLLVTAVYAFLSHCLCLGICMPSANIFIYPMGYVKSDAPRYNQSGEKICVVKINMEIWAINEIFLQKQELEVDLMLTILWKDHRLTVSSNISSESSWPVMDKTEINQIWRPTILFRNCKGCPPISLSQGQDLYVNKSNGVTLAQIRFLHRFSCAIDLRAYPMDIQFCHIQLYTYEDTIDAIQFQHRYPHKEINMDGNLTLAEYKIAPIVKTNCVFKDAEGDAYSCLGLRFRLEHLVTYHLMTSYAPTSFIVMLSWISFWLPLDLAPARVALGLTSLLTLATRLDQAQKNLPSVAYPKAIDIWMFACIFLVSSSLCEFAFSHYQNELRKKKVKTEPKPFKARPFFVKKNKLICGTGKPKSHISSDQSGNQPGSASDRFSRIIFPLTFLVFNIVYWSYYLTYYK